MLAQAMSASTDMYKENSRILALLDDKAQKTATLAGIFLAAAFAFLRKDALQDLRAITGGLGMFLLAAAIVLALACVFTGGLVLWARKLQLPPNPNKILDACDLFLEAQADEAIRENHIRDQTKSWNRALQAQDSVIEDKSQKLLVAQSLLVAAMLAVVFLLGLAIFNGKESSPNEKPTHFDIIPAGVSTWHVALQRDVNETPAKAATFALSTVMTAAA
jgi:hypothetical protein